MEVETEKNRVPSTKKNPILKLKYLINTNFKKGQMQLEINYPDSEYQDQ